ncbi:MAG: hypothetical protein HY350_02305 [Candidatus Omnitrophica bacterium]|nr:hypothetical protein [Candidatus Omnitrophota bacterium]
MAAAILNQGLTAIRNSFKTLVTHVGVSTDNTAFSAAQIAIDPTGTGTNLIKASTDTDVDLQTFDSTISIDGDTEFTNQTIWTISALQGATRTDALTRSVRIQGIGVQAGDLFTIGIRNKNEDNS